MLQANHSTHLGLAPRFSLPGENNIILQCRSGNQHNYETIFLTRIIRIIILACKYTKGIPTEVYFIFAFGQKITIINQGLSNYLVDV